ncbi:hypothetical protein KCP77_02730 [Salmonella enterica subsp. enterica]|nr:hypothetical protein KCP77_02730 [Salmonella enterica subsp. enterica]
MTARYRSAITRLMLRIWGAASRLQPESASYAQKPFAQKTPEPLSSVTTDYAVLAVIGLLKAIDQRPALNGDLTGDVTRQRISPHTRRTGIGSRLSYRPPAVPDGYGR